MAADLTVEEIKRIRGKYGLSQQAFARLLGIGEASMVRYENGQKPSKANANLIRAADNPAFMAQCLENDGDSLTPSQRKNAEQVVYAMVTFDEGGNVLDINEMYMLTLEQEILNEKAAELLAEVSRLLMKAEDEGDEVGKVVYEDVLTLLARAKGEIIHPEYNSFAGVAMIKGRIDSLERMIRRSSLRAA